MMEFANVSLFYAIWSELWIDRKILEHIETCNYWTCWKTKMVPKMIRYKHKQHQILFLFPFLDEVLPPDEAGGFRTGIKSWVSFRYSCHCGIGTSSSLSLDFQHMCGWPCSGSYSNSRAIDSNSFFLLTRSFISPPPPPLFINDPQNWSKVLRSVVAHVVYHYQFVFSFFLVVWRTSQSKLFSEGKLAIKDCSDATATSLSSI